MDQGKPFPNPSALSKPFGKGTRQGKLEEGPLMLTNLVHCRPDELSIGMPVEVTFEKASDEITLYKFKPGK